MLPTRRRYKPIMYYVYTIGLCLAITILIPLFAVREIRMHKYLSGLRQRFGVGLPPSTDGKLTLWIHAVSVGEVLAAQPLVQAILNYTSDYQIVFSTTTKTGQLVASRRLSSAVRLFYFPVDLPCVIRRALKAIKPSIVLLIETEIWPNFLRLCAHRNIPVLLVNGRISERSFRRYKLVSGFIRSALNHFHLMLMQSQQDAARAITLGANAQKVIVTGNLKYDAIPPTEPPDIATIVKQIQTPDSNVIVAGSTVAGEESIILEAFAQLLSKRTPNNHQRKNLRLILAPRHPERWAEVERLLKVSGLRYVRRSMMPCQDSAFAQVVLLDSMGELAFLYSIARIAFVGGSLVPVGGHNILEPALFGKPIIVGPYTANFQQITTAFLQAGAMMQLPPHGNLTKSLLEAFESLLENEPTSNAMGEAAKQLIKQHRGATANTLAHIKKLLPRHASQLTAPPCQIA